MASLSQLQKARGVQPRAFTLELTKGCNLRCAYCYYAQRDDAYDPSTRMSREVAEQSVDVLLRDGPEGEPIHLHFFGGEPLLNFPILEHTVLYAEEGARKAGKEVTFEVTTNGTRFDDKVIAFLNEHKVHVGVSFDGPPDVQDVARPAGPGQSSYAMAEPGIRKLLDTRRGTELELKTHCSVVVTRAEPDLHRISGHLEDLGFKKIILTPTTDLEGEEGGFRDDDLPWVYEKIDELADDYEARIERGEHVAVTWFPILMSRVLSGERKMAFCSGGQDYLGVAADGSVSLCYRFYEDDNFSMGSVQDGIDRGVTEQLEENSLEERTTCSRCWARYFCGGGCHHDNVQSGGGLGEPNPVTCDIFRHGMGRTLEMWARLSQSGRLGGRSAVDPLPGATQTATMTAQPFTDDARPTKAPGAHVRDLGGEKVVYEPVTHELVVLNATAAFIFESCDGERSVTGLLEALQDRYDAPADVLRRDLDATLTDLRAKKLLL